MELSTEILIMLSLLMLSIMGGHYLKKKHHKYLQESGLTVLIGAIAGLVLKSMSYEAYMTNLSNHFVRLFMLLLLPPIIFESGFNMQKKYFFRNIGSIILYAFLGTFIAIISSSAMFYAVGLFPEISPSFTVQESLAFGALISSTDPVAVLSIFKQMDVDMTLYIMIFGESIFNDAISIVMYTTVHESTKRNETFQSELAISVRAFLIILMGSVAIGMTSALITAYILKRQANNFQREQQVALEIEKITKTQQQYKRKQNVNTEISMMILCPWVSYLIAEGFELSGIVAIMVNGIFLSYYAQPNISNSARSVLKTGYETVAQTAETLVFIFLGVALFAFNHPYEQMGPWLVPITIINLGISRFLNVGIVSFLVNKSRTTNKITKRFQLVMWLGGLRGAMAYALAMKSSFDFEKGPVMLIVTLLYAFISILLIGSLLYPILTKLDVTNKSVGEAVSVRSNENQLSDENEQQIPLNCCNKLKKILKKYENKYFSPVFISDAISERNVNDMVSVGGDTHRFDQAKLGLINKDSNN
ncbi:sodium hydrogen exchanger 8-like [Stylonychia lemnae]|uniref:Sodium hydrogen exchanger 8-like n=1 Tax=Stylonychia lemnae TaxID=5949 RepID=A0A077ZYS5_STYLE|nr:sodium hydrogen exchanger 8-like [Stylonychia lemnae]|eukprot:CDW75106.1 sodium hydrogen exchanger 8-like [Stylonychia lemnae]